jgi:hypothetical protein
VKNSTISVIKILIPIARETAIIIANCIEIGIGFFSIGVGFLVKKPALTI